MTGPKKQLPAASRATRYPATHGLAENTAGWIILHLPGGLTDTIASVAVDNCTIAYDRVYNYSVPAGIKESARAGCRVRIPFGRGNKSRTGLILSVSGEDERRDGLKPVLSVLDSEPILNNEGLKLLNYLREYTFCTYFDALRTLIPAGLGVRPMMLYCIASENFEGLDPELLQIAEYIKSKSRGGKNGVEETLLCKALGIDPSGAELTDLARKGIIVKTELIRQRVRDEKICMARICVDAPVIRLTKRQTEAVAFLEENGEASLKEICYYTGVTKSVLDRLSGQGIIEYYDAPSLRSPFQDDADSQISEPPELSADQREALEFLTAQLSAGNPKPALLYGVTGSGKTEVFLSLIDVVLSKGQGVIVLVPEISLTAQTVRSFQRRFGGNVAMLHSGLSLGERMDEWKRIRMGGASIVIGTRSAVFAPLRNIGLIVMDEEQEHTYHSEKSPRFHTRDVARLRCAHHGALLLLASATPSVESYYYAKSGTYSLCELHSRFGSSELPDVYMVDMADSGNLSSSAVFSEMLLEELHYNLKHGEQSILLLNRRGYSTLIRCMDCGNVEECPNCSVSQTYHSANDSLVCHYCGYSKKRPQRCSKCGSEMVRYTGYGTQKIQEELEALYPSAKILRIDMDTTLSKFSYEKMFNSFLAKEYDIMIGTQMVAKGLNFPDVTLVGVIAADQSLYATDFRSFERSFSLLTQVVGRSGRGVSSGRAVIQTYVPGHPIIQRAANQDYPAFYASEIQSRKYHLYPPFCVMAGVGFTGLSLGEVVAWSERFLARFSEMAKEYPGLPIRVLGPVAADTLKAAGKYRQKLIIKCRNNKDMRNLLRDTLNWFSAECRTVSAFIDMYYDRI